MLPDIAQNQTNGSLVNLQDIFGRHLVHNARLYSEVRGVGNSRAVQYGGKSAFTLVTNCTPNIM